MTTNMVRTAVGLTLACAVFLLLSSVAAAPSSNVEGVINGRSGATMTVQTQDSGNVTAVLTPATQERFGDLADCNILGETTVLFGNDRVTIEDQYKPRLLQLAQQAKGITAHILQVKGHASKVGSAALNQRLSTDRAENVTKFLEQQGGIPRTNIPAPGAMDQQASSSRYDSRGAGRKSPRRSRDPAEQGNCRADLRQRLGRVQRNDTST